MLLGPPKIKGVKAAKSRELDTCVAVSCKDLIVLFHLKLFLNCTANSTSANAFYFFVYFPIPFHNSNDNTASSAQLSGSTWAVWLERFGQKAHALTTQQVIVYIFPSSIMGFWKQGQGASISERYIPLPVLTFDIYFFSPFICIGVPIVSEFNFKLQDALDRSSGICEWPGWYRIASEWFWQHIH